jgi:hypothetical protein
MIESDWKFLRKLRPVALERLCESALGEVAILLADRELSNHERFLVVFRRIHDRNDDIAKAFDDVRRSTADQRLAAMCALGLVRQNELSQFTEETQRRVALYNEPM